jgi:hypothetical protein
MWKEAIVLQLGYHSVIALTGEEKNMKFSPTLVDVLTKI